MRAQDVHIKLTDPTGVHPAIICYHRVWDKDLFVAAQKHQHEVKAKPEDRRDVSVVSEEEYNRWKSVNK